MHTEGPGPIQLIKKEKSAKKKEKKGGLTKWSGRNPLSFYIQGGPFPSAGFPPPLSEALAAPLLLHIGHKAVPPRFFFGGGGILA